MIFFGASSSPEKYHCKRIHIINVVFDGYLYVTIVTTNIAGCPLSNLK
jgi:hypothetical protein